MFNDKTQHQPDATPTQSNQPNPPLIVKDANFSAVQLDGRKVELLNFTPHHKFLAEDNECILSEDPSKGQREFFHFDNDFGPRTKMSINYLDGSYFESSHSVVFPEIYLKVLPEDISSGLIYPGDFDFLQLRSISILLLEATYANQLGQFLQHYNPGIAVAHLGPSEQTAEDKATEYQQKDQLYNDIINGVYKYTAPSVIRQRAYKVHHGDYEHYRSVIFDAVPSKLAHIQLGQPVFLQLDCP